MSVDVDTTTITNNLKLLASQNARVRNKALRAGAKVIEEGLVKNTKEIKGKGDKEHMTDNVSTGNVKDGEIIVGFNKSVAWRVHFTEFGTIRQNAKGFIQRTEDELQNEVMNVVANELRKGFGL